MPETPKSYENTNVRDYIITLIMFTVIIVMIVGALVFAVIAL